MTDAPPPPPESAVLVSMRILRERATGLRASDPDEAARCERLADELEKGWINNIVQTDLEEYRTRQARWLDSWRRHDDWYRENDKSIIAFSNAAQRNVILVNAGAAVALLTLMGNLMTRGVDISSFVASLVWFSGGVFFGVATTALAYATQLAYGSDQEKHNRLGKRLHISAVVVGFLALISFVGGCAVTFMAFSETESATSAIEAPEKRNNPPPKRPPPTPPQPIPVAPLSPQN